MRPTVLVALALVLAVPAAVAEAREWTVFGTLQAQPADTLTGYYPAKLVLEVGDAVTFDTLTPTDGEHPAFMWRDSFDGDFVPADCHPEDPDDPCLPSYGRRTRYSGLAEGAYVYRCGLHPEMTGSLDVVADLT